MKSKSLRLDDAARAVIHYCPEALFELYDPVECSAGMMWSKWQPSTNDESEVNRVRTMIRRLDTQLAPSRWIPDAAYSCEVPWGSQLWACELQSTARHAPLSRAGTCMAHLLRQAYPALPAGGIETRAIEVRIRRAPMLPPRRGSQKPGLHGAKVTDKHLLSTEGLCCFVPSDRLIKINPNDPRFGHPSYWPFVCLSPRVSANHIEERYKRLLELELLYQVPFPEVRLLLGLVGRARFTNDPRFTLMMENAVNDAHASTVMNFGYMTERERRQILLDANERQTRLMAERIRQAAELGEQLGEQRGEQRGEQHGALKTARAVLSALRAPAEVEQAMVDLTRLETCDAINAALLEILTCRDE